MNKTLLTPLLSFFLFFGGLRCLEAQVFQPENEVAPPELVEIVSDGTTKEVIAALKQAPSLNLYTHKKKKHTLLTMAIQLGRPAIVEAILQAGASPQFSTPWHSPLALAVKTNQPEMVRMLLMAGANPNLKDKLGRTPIHHLQRGHSLQIARLLVEAGADLSHRDDRGKSVFMSIDGTKYPQLYAYLQSMLQVQKASVHWPTFRDGPYVFDIDSSTVTVSWFYHDSARQITYRTDTLLSHSPAIGFTDRFSGRKQLLVNDLSRLNSPNQAPAADSIIVVGDVHGQFDQLIHSLQKAGVINSKNEWAFGKNTLVFMGDLVDRGKQVTETLWLVHNLMQQAQQGGGEVIALLGNHEELLIVGDDTYVDSHYTYLWRYFNLDPARLFSMKNYFGKFLRNRPVMVRRGNTLFVHAGVSSELWSRSLSIDSVNLLINNFLTNPNPTISDTERLLMLDKGPLWSRTYFRSFDPFNTMTDSVVQLTLDKYRVKRIVVGHTEIPQIMSLFGGKVVAVNVPFYNLQDSQLLLITKDELLIIDADGRKKQLFQSVE